MTKKMTETESLQIFVAGMVYAALEESKNVFDPACEVEPIIIEGSIQPSLHVRFASGAVLRIDVKIEHKMSTAESVEPHRKTMEELQADLEAMDMRDYPNVAALFQAISDATPDGEDRIEY